MKTIHDITVKDAGLNEISLGDYKGAQRRLAGRLPG